MEDNESVSSESTGESTVTEEVSSQETSTPEAAATETAAETTQEVKAPAEPPFHEHPRFKELIEQNREAKQREEKYQQDMYRLQAQLEALRENSKPKPEPVKDQFLADLEKVNPAYAKSLEPIYAAASQAKALEQRLAQFEQAQFAEKAVSHFNKSLDDLKITDPMDRRIMDRAVRAEVYEREQKGQKLTLKDLDKITNDFHAEYKATMDARERAITAKYVQNKQNDKAPKGATGGAAKSPVTKKLAADDFAGQAKWLADSIRALKKEH